MIKDIKYKDYTQCMYKFMKTWDDPYNKTTNIPDGAEVVVCWKELNGKIIDSVTFVNGKFHQQNKI